MLAFFITSRSSSIAMTRSSSVARSLATQQSLWFSTSATSETSAQATTQQQGKEELINVPKSMVRFLIGFKGRNLASLSERSGGAKILFTKQETPQGEEIAKITGDANQVAQMRQLIKEDLEKLQENPTATAAGKATENDYMEEVIVDSQYVGFLIGKQGAVLKEMEGSTGAKIQYSTRDDVAHERTARIRGTPNQVQSAKKLISDRIYSIAEELRTGKRFDARGERPNGRSRTGSPSDVKQVVEVPSECVGPLIGKGGKSLFQMQDQTGAKFNFAKEDHRDGAREVTILGSEEQIRAACDLIQQRVRQVLERSQNAGQ